MSEGPHARSEACPGREELAGLVLGEGETASRRSLADHVVVCRACAADFRLLRELHAEASRQRAWRAPRVAALAAGLAAVLALVLLVPTVLREPPEGIRGRAPAVQPPAAAVLKAPPERLAWEAVPHARGYRVKLFRSDATLLWESGSVGQPPVRLPREVREAMTAGGSWYWTVENAGPVPRRRLGPFWFEVRRP